MLVLEKTCLGCSRFLKFSVGLFSFFPEGIVRASWSNYSETICDMFVFCSKNIYDFVVFKPWI